MKTDDVLAKAAAYWAKQLDDSVIRRLHALFVESMKKEQPKNDSAPGGSPERK